MSVCSICLADIENYQLDYKTLSCGHKYHMTCIDIWLQNNNTCPYCRNILGTSKYKKYIECFVKSFYIICILLLNITLSGLILEGKYDIYDFVLCIFIISAFVILIIYNICITFELSIAKYIACLLEILITIILFTCLFYLIDYSNRLKDKEIQNYLLIINLFINIFLAFIYSKFRLLLFIEKYLIVQYYINICN
jgi:hypothetical protein